MQELLTASAATATAIYLIVFANWHNMLRLNFKPFNCTLCLSVWLYIAFSFMPSIIIHFLCGSLAGISAALLTRLIERWK